MKTPHKHAEIIKAWADGAEIEYKCEGEWLPAEAPIWPCISVYRIKPEPKPDLIQYGAVSHGERDVPWTEFQTTLDNLKLTFDGETGKLKAAEVLK